MTMISIRSEDEINRRMRLQREKYLRDLQKQIEEKRQITIMKKKEDEDFNLKKDREILHYNPFGRGGCGAPLKDNDGNPITCLQTLHMEALEKTKLISVLPPQEETVIMKTVGNFVNSDSIILKSKSTSIDNLLNSNTGCQTNIKKQDIISVPSVSACGDETPIEKPHFMKKDNANSFSKRNETISFTQSGGGAFTENISEEEKRKSEKYRSELRNQIEERKSIVLHEAEKERQLIKLEEKRIAEQQKKILKEFEEERQRQKAIEKTVEIKNGLEVVKKNLLKNLGMVDQTSLLSVGEDTIQNPSLESLSTSSLGINSTDNINSIKNKVREKNTLKDEKFDDDIWIEQSLIMPKSKKYALPQNYKESLFKRRKRENYIDTNKVSNETSINNNITKPVIDFDNIIPPAILANIKKDFPFDNKPNSIDANDANGVLNNIKENTNYQNDAVALVKICKSNRDNANGVQNMVLNSKTSENSSKLHSYDSKNIRNNDYLASEENETQVMEPNPVDPYLPKSPYIEIESSCHIINERKNTPMMQSSICLSYISDGVWKDNLNSNNHLSESYTSDEEDTYDTTLNDITDNLSYNTTQLTCNNKSISFSKVISNYSDLTPSPLTIEDQQIISPKVAKNKDNFSRPTLNYTIPKWKFLKATSLRTSNSSALLHGYQPRFASVITGFLVSPDSSESYDTPKKSSSGDVNIKFETPQNELIQWIAPTPTINSYEIKSPILCNANYVKQKEYFYSLNTQAQKCNPSLPFSTSINLPATYKYLTATHNTWKQTCDAYKQYDCNYLTPPTEHNKLAINTSQPKQNNLAKRPRKRSSTITLTECTFS